MDVVDATSDPIESFFGIHDLVGATMSKNTSFHVTSGIATWRHNRTSAFLHNLSTTQLNLILHNAVKHGRRLKRAADKRERKAAEHKLKHLEKQAKKTRVSEKKFIKALIQLRQEVVFKTVEQYEAFVVSVNDDYKKLLKELKKQIRVLRKVSIPAYIHTRSHACTHARHAYITNIFCMHIGIW